MLIAVYVFGVAIGVVFTIGVALIAISASAKAKQRADFERVTRPSPYRELMKAKRGAL